MAPPSPEVAKAAAGMSEKDVKDFAKHDGLPKKKTLKEFWDFGKQKETHQSTTSCE